jgi:hypothetical protein
MDHSFPLSQHIKTRNVRAALFFTVFIARFRLIAKFDSQPGEKIPTGRLFADLKRGN